LDWIFENIKSIEFKTVLDAFGGTASTSLLFKAMGKDVTYHDAFTFNKYVAETVLGDKLSVSRAQFLRFLSEVKPMNGFIAKTFQNCYYTEPENQWLDGCADKIFSAVLSNQQKALYLYTLFQACLQKRPFNLFHRVNLNLRLNRTVKRNFGNYTTWQRSFTELMLRSYDELSASLWKGRGDIKILEPSNVAEIKSGFDLVYLDPPYISRIDRYNEDDYWKKYHFLEGLSQYRQWTEMIDKESSLKCMPIPEIFRGWNHRTSFAKQLYAVIRKHKKSIVVLSYVSDAVPSEDSIAKLFRGLFREVSVHSKEHAHALAKKKKRELLFIGRP
jgi:adenine-specific DNA-methyltransferase